MSTENVNGSNMDTKIREIFKSHDNSRKGRIDTLNEISKEGKEILDSLNTMDKTLYEIEDDYKVSVEEYEQMEELLEAKLDESESLEGSIDDADSEIEELEAKISNGEELTEAESLRLRELYTIKDTAQYKYNSANNNIESISGKFDGFASKISNYQDQLDDIVSNMDGYAEAGESIKKASETYGRDIDSERVMERNETSWWNFFSTKSGQKTQMDKYTQRAGLSEVSDQTFYSKDTGFVSEYEAITEKGGNQVGGALRKATVETFSYGKTINSASNIIKNKADNIDKDV